MSMNVHLVIQLLMCIVWNIGSTSLAHSSFLFTRCHVHLESIYVSNLIEDTWFLCDVQLLHICHNTSETYHRTFSHLIYVFKHKKIPFCLFLLQNLLYLKRDDRVNMWKILGIFALIFVLLQDLQNVFQKPKIHSLTTLEHIIFQWLQFKSLQVSVLINMYTSSYCLFD